MTSQTSNLTTPALRISNPAVLLRLEGLAVFIIVVALYAHLRGSGLLFAALLLVPDVSMIAYGLGKQVGANVYNVVHLYALPLALAVAGLAAGSPLVVHIALIWLAHIGMDRLFGYGLKYPTDFKDTHLSRL